MESWLLLPLKKALKTDKRLVNAKNSNPSSSEAK
jgi:hypothetical protein